MQQAVARTDGQTWYTTVCYNCSRLGHRAALCPEVVQDSNTKNGDGKAKGAGNLRQGQGGVSHLNHRETVTEINDNTTIAQETGEYGVTFSQMVKCTKELVDHSWVLLDSQSTHSIFSNSSLLTNICHCGHSGLTMNSNGRSQQTVMIGDYEPLGITVWYNEHSLANILAMRDIRRVA